MLKKNGHLSMPCKPPELQHVNPVHFRPVYLATKVVPKYSMYCYFNKKHVNHFFKRVSMLRNVLISATFPITAHECPSSWVSLCPKKILSLGSLEQSKGRPRRSIVFWFHLKAKTKKHEKREPCNAKLCYYRELCLTADLEHAWTYKQ